MKCVFVLPSNISVTEYYLNIIKDGIAKKNIEICNYHNNIIINKEDILLSTNLMDAVKVILRYPKNTHVYWMQGIEPEESYVRNHSGLRRSVLNFLEKKILKNVNLVFFVSEEMRKYCEEKHTLELDKKSFYMPCFNTEIVKESFYFSNKYNKNTFAYVGSLAKWQCFEETLNIYSMIEDFIPCCKLYVFTSEKDNAEKLLKKMEISNYEILFVKPEKLHEELAKIKYGFCLREDTIVNNVATPTKISSYLSSGLIPIFSQTIRSFSEQTNEMSYRIQLENLTDIETILEFCKINIDANQVFTEYENLFKDYYNRSEYVNRISQLSIFEK